MSNGTWQTQSEAWKPPTSYLDANSLSNEWLHQIGGGAQVHAGGQAGFGYSDLLPTFYERQSVEGDDGILWPQVAPLQWLAAYRGGKAGCDWQRIHQLWKKLIKNTTWYTCIIWYTWCLNYLGKE